MPKEKKSSLGEALDAVIEALQNLDDQARVITVRAACEHLGIIAPYSGDTNRARSQPRNTPDQTPTVDIHQPPQPQVTDIRTLKETKNPSSAIEMACLVAYYLDNHAPTGERSAEIQTKDIERYFKQADYPLPKVPNQVLIDAKAGGYFDSAGRGRYKLNPVGYNLVAHSLPRQKGKRSK